MTILRVECGWTHEPTPSHIPQLFHEASQGNSSGDDLVPRRSWYEGGARREALFLPSNPGQDLEDGGGVGEVVR